MGARSVVIWRTSSWSRSTLAGSSISLLTSSWSLSTLVGSSISRSTLAGSSRKSSVSSARSSRVLASGLVFSSPIILATRLSGGTPSWVVIFAFLLVYAGCCRRRLEGKTWMNVAPGPWRDYILVLSV